MAAEYKARVGARIRQAREAKGWTQSRLARELPESVDGPSVSRWENAKVAPGPDYLEALALALDVDLSFFLAPEPEPGTPDLLGALGAPNGDVAQLDRIEAKLDAVLSLLGAGEDPGEVAERVLAEAVERDERSERESARAAREHRRAS